MTARLARYAWWQAQDYLLERALSTLLIGALLVLNVALQVREVVGDGPPAAATDALAGSVLRLVLGLFAAVATLLSVNGLVSNDRQRGYFRVLFAKPVSVPRYYAQAFLVGGAGMLVVTAVVLALFALVVVPPRPAGALAYTALVYATLGGVGFLCSALFRLDWLALLALWGSAEILHRLSAAARGWREALLWLLPPTEALDRAGDALLAGGAPETSALARALAYGAICFVLGLVVLARRPLAG
jgi:ABC-type transport system involved in multi-copper enzyme maturation permease subunit